MLSRNLDSAALQRKPTRWALVTLTRHQGSYWAAATSPTVGPRRSRRSDQHGPASNQPPSTFRPALPGIQQGASWSAGRPELYDLRTAARADRIVLRRQDSAICLAGSSPPGAGLLTLRNYRWLGSRFPSGRPDGRVAHEVVVGSQRITVPAMLIIKDAECSWRVTRNSRCGGAEFPGRDPRSRGRACFGKGHATVRARMPPVRVCATGPSSRGVTGCPARAGQRR